jgi:hypothetical protein
VFRSLGTVELDADAETVITLSNTGTDGFVILDALRRHFISAITAALGGSVFAADGKPKTIVLQSAWDTVNIGDIGHTPGTLRVIEEHLPEVKDRAVGDEAR